MSKFMIDAITGSLIPIDRGFSMGLASALAFGSGGVEGIREYRMDHMERRTDAAIASMDSGRRQDAMGSGGIYTSRAVEFVSAKLFEDRRPALSSFALFPTWPEAPVGAEKMTIERVSSAGEAHVYRAGRKIPTVGVTGDSESFKFVPVVTSRETTIFQRATDVFAGGKREQAKQRTAVRAILEKVNRVNWYGEPESGIYGVLTYPYLNVVESSVVISAATSAQDIIDEIERVMNWAQENSGGVYSPSRCVTSNRLWNRLGRKYDDSGKTIRQWIVDNSQHIKAIETAPELREPFGDTNIDAMLFYRDDVESIALSMPVGVQEIPVQQREFGEVIYSFAITGGVIMIDAADNMLILFEVL